MKDPHSFMECYERHRQAQAELNQINKAALFDALAAAQIAEVLVDFDGCGDSGQIESVAAFAGGQPATLPQTTVAIQSVPWGGSAIVSAQQTLEHAIETLCYSYLEDSHDGWENNDGAYGEFRFDVAKRTIDLEFNGRYTDVHTEGHTF